MNRKIEGLLNSFANVTPERHARKVREFTEMTDQESDNKSRYAVLDGQSWIESYRCGIGATAMMVFAGVGFQNLANGFAEGDASKVIAGLCTLAVAVRTAKMPIRAIDNSNAVEEVIFRKYDEALA